MKWNLKTRQFDMDDGRILCPNRGIYGISGDPEDSVLYEGYDNPHWEPPPDLVEELHVDIGPHYKPEFKREIALCMIERWKQWGGL